MNEERSKRNREVKNEEAEARYGGVVARLTCRVGGTATESHGMAVRGKTTYKKKDTRC